ncbi:MAG: ORF6N domain-containing protein [Deltaproteobacteria bacterium]|nr:ORF6N domain-containing protein [Deltaproteobacteria bacterium]
MISPDFIERRIYLIRKQKVMLDSDLAELYGVKPIRLREQVKRNRARFPEDFMFQLTDREVDVMVSQNAIPSRRHLGGFLPYVFTQEGVAMLSSVLRSERAITVNIAIMRAFVKLREMLSTHKDLADKLEALEKRYDRQFKIVFDAIRQLMKPEDPPKERRIGF